MSLTIEITEQPGHLLVQVSGTYDLDDATDRFGLVLSACQASGCGRVLIDYRDMAGRVAAIQKILYAMDVSMQYGRYLERGGSPLRVAYLGSTQQVGTYEPSIEIARQEQLPFALSTDIREALSWLEQDDA